MKMRICIQIFCLLMGSLAFANNQAKFDRMFTEAEKLEHLQKISLITSTASACLQETWDDHVDFHSKNGVSKYYGSRRKDYATLAGRIAGMRKLGISEQIIREVSPLQEPTSCVGLAIKCLRQGFKAAGTESTFAKIETHLRIDNNVFGHELQMMLQELGWRIVYWNPDPASNAKWDLEDRKLTPPPPGKQWAPVWGNHQAHYNTVMNKGSYYGIKVDDRQMLNGFNTTIPEVFKQQPFFVGIAHAGYHVFPGSFGKIIEGHSMRNIDSIDNMQVSDFNPLAPGGGPKWTRTEKYRSGLIAIPPQ